MADEMTDQGRALRETAKRWLGRIEDAKKREKEWRDDATVAVKAYSGEGVQSELSENESRVAYDFNILFANVETIVPAVINSPPAPDIRRRFGTDDPVARDFAELLERAIRVQVDDGKLQVELEAMAQDGFLAGRGVVRLRMMSDFRPSAEDVEASGDGDETPPEQPENERICFEAVSWRDCVYGPAKRWDGVSWWAFRHAMPPDELDEFGDPTLLDCQGADDDADRDRDDDLTVWEVWDKKSRKVTFVNEGTGKVVKEIDDPLGLTRFFPIATPVQPIEITGRLMPVNPFSLYRRLADELDVTTKRIRIITKQLKVKGWYGFDPTTLSALLQSDDNEFVPIPDPEQWAANGGVNGAIAFWPVEKLIVVLAQLYTLREQTKQSIYEITGISDIVRGASKAAETLGAQQIKSQWGSLRIQKMQRMMERAARDLFVMMSEIIPAKFSGETLQKMTEIQVDPSPEEMQPAQDPQAEQARQQKLQHLQQLQSLMREKASTYHRIDVETDSTIKADLTRQKQEASEFMTAASGYFTAVGPLVQQGALPVQVAVEIFSSFSRMFNLGKSVEDALDELVSQAKQKAEEPPAEDPAKAAADAEAQGKQQAMAADIEIKKADAQAKAQAYALDMQVRQATAQADISGKMLDQSQKKVELQIKGVELQIKEADLALKQQQLLMPSLLPTPQGSAGG